ncbi:MAG: UDP-3-O-[3-hydroxymyristoyl] N-acetylglucosamine deacetylase [Phycisphaerae bacterium]|jgi:UDP-3-O-[3-hydroxymyristoyl] N-acetylglucosamine deacetylase/3-hydroxyacyl-[acyl-carrier-protein] dehydratase|nr:UDP-3-O-[3-hydroxymyristoyl] N-acetylglucosamine deacetylase [Phycisphaerae bacterium]
MSLNKQYTIANETTIEGKGLFTSEPVTVRFKPAAVNSGVVFVRTDQGNPVRIPARPENIARRPRRTSLRNGTLGVETVEHCLAAISGLGVDNIEIEITGPELPGVDGSGRPFVRMIQQAGLVEQDVPRQVYEITEAITVREGDAMIAALPGDTAELSILYDLDYSNNKAVGRQVYAINLTPEQFLEQISPCRTFLLEKEAEYLRQSGYGGHLTYQDILVLGANGPIDNELRFPDECVRHKILDLIGDLSILGRRITGRIVCYKSGHSLNQALVKKLSAKIRQIELERQITAKPILDIRQIQRILPHRYPFLLVDRVIEIDGDRRAVGIKNVTINEPFFNGHFPQQPIMPGVLIVEALAQLSGLLLSQKLEHTGKLAVLLSLDNVKIRRPVIPGDQLILEANTVRVKQRTGHVRCNARVGDALAAEATIKFMLVDADNG